jgi:hypothetical protein
MRSIVVPTDASTLERLVIGTEPSRDRTYSPGSRAAEENPVY